MTDFEGARIAEDGRCPWCRKPGTFAFPPYWMHDVDADAHRCPRGNHWTLAELIDGEVSE